jgi:hypothetical protein
MDCIDMAQDRDQWRTLVTNKHSDAIKCWKVLEQLHNWWPLEKRSAPRI